MRKLTKGKIGILTFQFNPTSITYGGGGWELSEIRSPGMSTTLYSTTLAKGKTLSFELYYNELALQPIKVSNYIASLERYRDRKTPVVFSYGDYAVRCLVSDFNVVGESYNSSLHMYEARVSITLAILS